MTLFRTVRRHSTAIVAAVLVAWSIPAAAQDISESHLKAARTAVATINATDEFDNILPQAAQALKIELINKDPNLEDLINQTVDTKAIELASRRADLEREAALAYARVFTEQELNEISAFYQTEAGKKLIAQGPIVMRSVYQAAEIWQRGLARDLAQEVAAVLEDEAPIEQGDGAGGGAEEAAPAQ
ncbi:DUF2059 domain-containing protein [Mesorhizobium xinjiangense]|uniref:DUF2059 domain-containing protein n=1 Tax=Mesorhizobium xinjiangense TaxID=2678685 RepID=UPI0012ED080E|nr:DUF2059 domain-containing protein [Mesorhizobium xinjiangense]